MSEKKYILEMNEDEVRLIEIIVRRAFTEEMSQSEKEYMFPEVDFTGILKQLSKNVEKSWKRGNQ